MDDNEQRAKDVRLLSEELLALAVQGRESSRTIQRLTRLHIFNALIMGASGVMLAALTLLGLIDAFR